MIIFLYFFSNNVFMEDLQKAVEFRKIIKKYKLDEPDKAEELAAYITKHGNNGIDVKEFSSLFGIELDDAHLFLEVLQITLELRKKHLKGNS
jgi:hypothetical protein